MATATAISATGNPEIDGLLSGVRWSGTITYSFPDSRSDYEVNYGNGETTAAGFGQAPVQMRSAINYAVSLIQGYTNASIVYAGFNSADIRVAQSSSANPTSYAYYPDNSGTGGDVWFGTAYNYSAAALGNYYFATAIHELGHAFGLKHAQETGGVANVAVPAAHDDLEYSVMSYLSYVGASTTGGYTNEANGYPQTYMANDILALQTMYGANFSTHSENTVYTWSPTTGQESINGVAQLAPGGGTGGSANRIFQTVWDGNGIDTYDLSNYTTSLSINLNPGACSVFSSAQLAYLGNGHYAQGNVYNADLVGGDARSYIENATGGGGNDTIVGNAVANNLSGGAGDDTITGGGGNDTIDGGAGTDTAVYSGNRANYAITYNSATQSFTVTDQRAGSPDGTDIVTNVEFFNFADGTVATSQFILPLHLVATGANVTLTGGALGDTLDDGGFAVTLAGGQGNDTYVVHNAGTSVIENSGGFTAPAGWTVKGTADFNHDGNLDVVVTNGTVNQFWLLNNGVVQSTVAAPTWGGSWQLVGVVDYNHDGNADLLQQSGTTQEVDYLNGTTYTGYVHPSGLTPDPLQSLSSNEGTDTVIASVGYALTAGVENLTLASGAGNINGTGNSLDNVIIGNEGNNILTGGGGIDTLTGGAGADTFVFATGDTGSVYGKRDVITDFTPGTDKIDLTGFDADAGTAGTQAFRFLGTAGFDGHAGALHTVYDAAHNITVVEGDTNGDGTADFGIELTGNKTLTMGDFTSGSLLVPLNLTAIANNTTLNGGALGDTLDDGGFAVTLAGGQGNDTYVVHNAGTSVIENSGGFTAPAGWTVKGTADFNHDGNLDVVVTNGTVNQFWLLNNGVVQSTVAAPTWGGSWQLVGVVDYNHDGNADLLQQSGTTQEVDYLNGTTYTGYVHPSGLTPDPLQSLSSNEGTDTVIASVGYALTAGVENLTLASGAGNINGTGNSLDNVIIGNEGNNILTGGGGIDTLTGGAGADTFVFATGDTGSVYGKRDVITDFTPGTDKIDLTGFDADAGTAGTQAFRFLGTAGFDGHAGALHTVYDAAHNITVVEGDTNGDGTADFGIELTGNKTLTMGDFTSGSLLVPLNLTAIANNTTLNGGALGDTLDDGGFAVTLAGGQGNDTYVVHNAGTSVIENSGGFTAPAGWTVKGTADFNHDGNLDVVVTNGTVNQFWLLNNGVVQSTVAAPTWGGSWQLVGVVDYNHDGNADLLQQSGTTQEVDYLNGTTYTGYVHPSGLTPDPLQSLSSNEGTDTVIASVGYALTAGVENLTLASGAGNINGTGNSLDNVIIGNEGNNILTGGGGIDTLTGGAGADTFVFATGDTGSVYGKRDVITDFTPGTDKIDLTGFDADAGTAGTQAFRFLGTAGFDGHAGALHTVYDAAHNITVVEGDTNGDGTADFGIELTGNKTLTMGDFTSGSLLVPLNLTAIANNTTLNGGALGDTLDDGGFAVTLAGGQGNDTYVVHNAGTSVIENSGGFTAPAGWTVKGTADFNHDGNLDVVVTNGTVNQFWLLNNGVVQSTVAAPTWGGSWQLVGVVDYNHDGNADLLQQSGTTQEVDYLNGTTYTGYVHPSGLTPDPLQSLSSNEGTDTVIASVGYALTAGVENLTLASGAGNINGTGNSLDNVIIGNEGNNILTGGGGIDTLTGGAGADTFVFATGDTGSVYGKRDVITDFTPGTDKIDLTGFDADAGTAGTQAFRFLGTAGFDGHAGALHTVYDAAHNITVVEGDTNGDGTADFGIELTGNKTLTMGDFTSGSLLVPLNLTAIANNTTLNGGALGDTLDDGGFAVTLAGGQGNDTYVVHNAGTSVIENSGGFTAPAGWTVKGTADFNHDGNLDVVVTNGTVNQFWLLNNGVVQSTVAAPTWGGSWQLVGVVDYNHDGNADLLQQSGTTQEVDYLNGTTYTGYVHPSGLTPDPLQSLSSNEGTDTVIASVGYALTAGVENLTLASGAGNINGTGNSLDNVIIGNEGNNILTGGGGIDTLTGGAGADTFVFATGDTGSVYGKRDVITDFTPGTDKIDLTGFDADAGTAGTQAFRFLGTAGFDGHAGALHTVYDAAHNITVVEGDTNGDGTADFGIELTGNKTLTMGDFTSGSLLVPLNLTAIANNTTLNGGALGDTLDDGGFAVTLAGGQGNDTYVVHNAGTSVIENSGGFTAPAGWTVKGTADFNHDGNLDVVVTNGTVNQFWLLNNGVVQSTVAAPTWGGSWQLVGVVDYNHDGNADLLQQSGTTQEVDYLNGTTYTGYVHPSGLTPDPLQSLSSNEGTDTVIASVGYALTAGVENLTLASGAGNINGTGNSLDNVIIGNEGNNILTGGGGRDTFVFAANFGHDKITDYQAGDSINFDHSLFASISDVLSHATNDGSGNAIVTLDAGDTLTVNHETVASLQQQMAFHLI